MSRECQVFRPVVAVIEAMIIIQLLPASLLLTSTSFQKENPVQCETEQGNQLFLGMFYWLKVIFFLQ